MIRVFPRKTKWTPEDDLSFIGDPPLFIPKKEIPVRISVTFTWDIPEGERLFKAWSQYYQDVQIGGPAFDDPGGDFVPGRFIKEGVTITSRGCPNRCPWCHASKREGVIRELPINPGWIISDNNLLACSREHIENVFSMLRTQNKAATFSGGIDSRLFKPWHVELFNSIKIKEIWFACDTPGSFPYLVDVSTILFMPRHKKRCYVMIGYGDESLYEAENRLEMVYAIGFDPFCQLYRGEGEREYSQDWKDLSRKWSRPAAYRKK